MKGKKKNKEVSFFCDLRFEFCNYLYDSYWRLTYSLTSGLVRLVEVRASWSKHLH
jgi:hypothetical protein